MKNGGSVCVLTIEGVPGETEAGGCHLRLAGWDWPMEEGWQFTRPFILVFCFSLVSVPPFYFDLS